MGLVDQATSGITSLYRIDILKLIITPFDLYLTLDDPLIPQFGLNYLEFNFVQIKFL